MKQKLLDLLAKATPYAQKVYAMSPFVAGVAVGYLGHPFIKLGVDIVVKTAHMVIG